MPFGTITLNDGREIPEIAFGTGSVWKGQDAAPYVAQAIYAGFSHIDTAQAYANEASVGLALKETAVARRDVWVTTKYGGLSADTMGPKEALIESLQKLGLQYVDLYLIHSPTFMKLDVPTAWKGFEDAAKAGLAKSIGVSNFGVEDLKLLLEHANAVPAVNQISLNPYNLAEMEPVLDFCKEHGIVVEAYSPLLPITRRPGGPVDVPVNKAANRLSATPGQILLSWIRSKGAVIVTTSSKRERLEEYLDVGDLPPLTAEEVDAIDEAGRSGSVQFGSPLSRIRRNARLAMETTSLRAKLTLATAVILVVFFRALYVRL